MSLLSQTQRILAGVSTATVTAAAPTSGQGVFAAAIMARVAYVTSSIPRLVGVEVVELLLPAPWQRSNVTVMGIIAVVDVAVEAVRAVKPGASANKYATGKPIGAVVAVGSAVIRGIVEVPIGAHRRDANVDGDLGGSYGNTADEGDGESGESQNLTVGHKFSFGWLEPQSEW
jgi:hypothetical protein